MSSHTVVMAIVTVVAAAGVGTVAVRQAVAQASAPLAQAVAAQAPEAQASTAQASTAQASTAQAGAAQKPAAQGGAAQAEAAKPGGKVNPRAEAVDAFNKRIEAYLGVRKKAESSVPQLKETDDPAKITAREQLLGDTVRKLRATAKAGDVFGSDMTPLILEIVRADWQKRPAADRAAIIAEMPKPFVPKVNMRYPVGQPLLTFPPNLLKQLHQLPEDLEYRFVGRDLILRDAKANIIVDVIRNARPPVRPA